MQQRAYGKMGYEVSAFGMGCMRLPRVRPDSPEVDLEKAFGMIRYAADHGVNYFDTAFGYHGGNSEAILGEALDGGRREKVKIATKMPVNAVAGTADIRRNLENTLKKLRTGFIDVFLLHNIQESTWARFQELKFLEEFEKFRAEGLIRGIGFSYHGEFPAFREILDAYGWDMCQVQQNLLDSDKEVTAEAITAAGQKGCALVIMEPLRGGGLATPPARVRAIYGEYPEKRTAAEWAFRHLLDRPEVSTILSGVSTMEQLKENIAIFSKPDALPGCLSAPEKEIIARAKKAYDDVVTIPCTACEYCMPCPQSVDIPGTFSKYNNGMMFENFENPSREYLFIRRRDAGAEHCIECGICLEKCPQHIDIVSSLKTAREKLDGWVE